MDSIHVTVAAIIKRNDKYLLVKERASSGQIVYNQPAGHVELNESLQDAVIREVMEETGLNFSPTALIGTYLLSPATNGKTYLRFCFLGDTPDDQQTKPQDPDIIDNVWMTTEQIMQIPTNELRSALVYNCMQDYLQGVRLPLKSLHFSDNELKLRSSSLEQLKFHK